MRSYDEACDSNHSVLDNYSNMILLIFKNTHNGAKSDTIMLCVRVFFFFCEVKLNYEVKGYVLNRLM